MTEARMVDTLPSDIAAFKRRSSQDVDPQQRLVALSNEGGLVESYYRMETFSFSAPEIGEIIFNVRGIKDALADGKLEFAMFEIDIPATLVEHVYNNNGVEEVKLAKMTPDRLEHPGIMVQWPDGHSTLIDGNHRLVARYAEKLRTFRFAMVLVDETLVPYMARPGEEEKFLPPNPEGTVTLATAVRML